MQGRDRLRDEDIAELVRRFAAGATQKALAAQYEISLSSVKRLFRRQDCRPHGPVDRESHKTQNVGEVG